jgi:hypothetical protein
MQSAPLLLHPSRPLTRQAFGKAGAGAGTEGGDDGDAAATADVKNSGGSEDAADGADDAEASTTPEKAKPKEEQRKEAKEVKKNKDKIEEYGFMDGVIDGVQVTIETIEVQCWCSLGPGLGLEGCKPPLKPSRCSASAWV